MIHRIYIIQLSGICVFHLDFASIQIEKNKGYDPQLLSGFFTAIMEFANTAAGGNYEGDGSRTFDMLSLKNRNFYISKNHKFYYVMEADQIDQNLTNDDVKAILEFIQQQFSSKGEAGIKAAETGELYVDEAFGNSIKEHVARMIRSKLFRKQPVKMGII